MARPSKPKPEKLFHFTITQLNKFIDAIILLTNKDFNPTGDGVIEVFEGGVDFSARNANSEVTGLLRLKSAALKDFHFDSRCKEKLMKISLTKIRLNSLSFYDSITFTHFDGSNDIIVNLDSDYYPYRKLELNISTIDPEFERFHDIGYIYESEIPSDSLREMLDRLDLLRNNNRFELVTVDISEKFVTVIVGDHPEPWKFEFVEATQVRSKMIPGHGHKARFNWVHLDVLKKVSRLAPTCVISFVIQPKDMIMTRFNLGDLGDFVFFDKAATIII